MMKSITQSSAHIQVTNGHWTTPYWTTTTSTSTNSHIGGSFFTGQMRWDTVNNQLLVFDGSNWVAVPSAHATIGLSTEAEQALTWAIKKQKEEQDLKQLLERSPALRDAYEKFQIVKTLVNEETRQST